MVAKVEGKINGAFVVFKHREGSCWEAVIPPSLDGIYVAELTAYDYAGNVSYTTKYIITIDLSALRISLEPYPFWVEMLPDRFCRQAQCGNYYAELLEAGL